MISPFIVCGVQDHYTVDAMSKHHSHISDLNPRGPRQSTRIAKVSIFAIARYSTFLKYYWVSWHFGETFRALDGGHDMRSTPEFEFTHHRAECLPKYRPLQTQAVKAIQRPRDSLTEFDLTRQRRLGVDPERRR